MLPNVSIKKLRKATSRTATPWHVHNTRILFFFIAHHPSPEAQNTCLLPNKFTHIGLLQKATCYHITHSIQSQNLTYLMSRSEIADTFYILHIELSIIPDIILIPLKCNKLSYYYSDPFFAWPLLHFQFKLRGALIGKAIVSDLWSPAWQFFHCKIISQWHFTHFFFQIFMVYLK